MQRSNRPTHAIVSRFFQQLVPLKDNDVERLYHVPRNPRYDPETAVVERIVLSIAPTPSIYEFIGYQRHRLEHEVAIPSARPPRTICFLHRPFTLDRYNVRKDTLVLSSHTSFDELLTVGWNVSLAERLGVPVAKSLCIQGYKGDSERKIGIIGRLSVQRDHLVESIHQQFGELEHVHEGSSSDIRVVAILNAFHEDEVYRVLEIALQQGWCPLDSEPFGRNILYLTGQPRMGGMEVAKALGITVCCVGHRAAEDWGIRHLAAHVRAAFPSVKVEEVHEEEILTIQDQDAKSTTNTTSA